MNNDSNEKRVFTCGCMVEWRLDKIKFTECAVHSNKEAAEVEAKAIDRITISV